MTTQLQIAQMALAENGTRSTITSLVDGSTEANAINLYYTAVRDQALRAARWNFAKRIDTLTLWKALPGTPEQTTAAIGTTWNRAYPAPPWLYSYLYPSDYIYARSVIAQPNNSSISPPLFPISSGSFSYPDALRVPFELANDGYSVAGAPITPAKQVILTNAPTALLEYTFDNTDETQWEASFVMVMVKALAAYTAMAMTSDKALAQMKIGEANNTIMQARANDGNESLKILDHVPDWLQVRGVSGGYGYDYYFPYGPLFSVY